MMKAYLANGLFSEADKRYNAYIAEELRKSIPGLDLYVPQENEALNDKSGYADSMMIFNGDNDYLDSAEVLIAVIDGVEIDSGVAAEIGRFAHIASKESYSERRILALYTDSRQDGGDNPKKVSALIDDPTENQFMYRNLYVLGAIKQHGVILSNLEQVKIYLEHPPSRRKS